ncbi:MAG: 4a-hydroxytetrahydrobiopterin dehydratase [Candidatus Omnitrophica bacterium]|nr:4a-hydroxytetrahydrobiopterin dehydratase [Candidatus Omnitrophota bacterium]
MVLDIKELTLETCQPCRKGEKPISRAEAEKCVQNFPGWKLSEDAKYIWREYLMKDFVEAIHLMDAIAQVAESNDHHPDLHLVGYRKLRIELSTHSIGGLSRNDFILAAKIEALPKELKIST